MYRWITEKIDIINLFFFAFYFSAKEKLIQVEKIYVFIFIYKYFHGKITNETELVAKIKNLELRVKNKE